ncbi:hypothetical protein MPSEU_000397700 [Mayamaea pseudoterrestris]|nr:hypothetical protein MPSEU_000397700 [Mayamaea pseudoterrestris]
MNNKKRLSNMFQVIYSSDDESVERYTTWHQDVTMLNAASHVAFRETMTIANHGDDNASLLSSALHCSSSDSTCTCRNNDLSSSPLQLLTNILRWTKLLVMKLASSYYARPIVLALLPLCIGALMGYYFGRTTRSRKVTRRSRRTWLLMYCMRLKAWWTAACHAVFRQPACIVNQDESSSMNEREKLTKLESLHDDDDDEYTRCESGLDERQVPRHVAIIMDGNRRYGNQVYGSATSGHQCGGEKLLQVAKWCMAEHVKVLTVFAFSTENWRRDPAEVAALMALFVQHCDQIREQALKRNMRVKILSTDESHIPQHVKESLHKLQHDTAHCHGGLEMNICLSYGGRGEIVNACRQLAQECVSGQRVAANISEGDLQLALLTSHTSDPDVLIRTSGEERISNFLLWQLAYTELFFLDCHWPEFSKKDLLKVMRSYAHGRRRRFGT